MPEEELSSTGKDLVEIDLEDVWHVIRFLDHLWSNSSFCVNRLTSFGLIRFISSLYYAF